jgi:hypothetical protein
MFRFTIRDVLWLTVVVAIAIGWSIDRTAVVRKFSRENASLAQDKARSDQHAAEA